MNPENQSEPDELQQAWKSESSRSRVMIDADLLREEVQDRQHNFRSTILWRDVFEIGVSLLMIPLWFYLGAVVPTPWTWYLTVPVLVWMAGFMLFYRMNHRPKPAEPTEPLADSIQNSLAEIESQIWLLRNIFWWYLLPPSVSLLTFFAHVSWSVPADVWWEPLASFSFFAFIVLVVYGFAYYINQRAVRVQLEPRKRELVSLLSSLTDNSNDGNTDDQIALSAIPFSEEKQPMPIMTPAKMIIGVVGFIVTMVGLGSFIVFMATTDPYDYTGEGYPRKSPFSAVRWNDLDPEVQVESEWYKLISLNDIPVDEIIACSKKTFEDRWKKRFEEDLVELLIRMEKPPETRVKLVLVSLKSGETIVLNDVRMTYVNRQAIRDAGQKRNDE